MVQTGGPNVVLPMPSPYKHPKTGVYWVHKVVPVELRRVLKRTELKVSLRTKDPKVAKEQVTAELDRFNAMLGSADRRTWWAGFAEHLSSNTHAHLLLRVVPDKAATFEALWSGDRNAIWSALAPAGTSVLKPLLDRENAANWAIYAMKEPDHLDNMILSRSLVRA